MKRLKGLFVAASALALIACASQGPPAPGATGASNASAPPGTTSAAAAQKKSFQPIPEGYRRVMINGEERFCTTDPETGSRIKKDQVCLTRDELNARQDSSRDFINNQIRQSGTYTGTGGSMPGPY